MNERGYHGDYHRPYCDCPECAELSQDDYEYYLASWKREKIGRRSVRRYKEKRPLIHIYKKGEFIGVVHRKVSLGRIGYGAWYDKMFRKVKVVPNTINVYRIDLT